MTFELQVIFNLTYKIIYDLSLKLFFIYNFKVINNFFILYFKW